MAKIERQIVNSSIKTSCFCGRVGVRGAQLNGLSMSRGIILFKLDSVILQRHKEQAIHSSISERLS